MIKNNKKLKVIGLCVNPIGNMPAEALVGPINLEVVMLRAIGLKKLSADVFGSTVRLHNIHLAGNNLTSVPSSVSV